MGFILYISYNLCIVIPSGIVSWYYVRNEYYATKKNEPDEETEETEETDKLLNTK